MRPSTPQSAACTGWTSPRGADHLHEVNRNTDVFPGVNFVYSLRPDMNLRVGYSTTVEIVRPVDMRRWNRALYHTVPNRGGATTWTTRVTVGE